MTIDDKFAVDAFVNSTYFNHSLYIALKTKDAIVDQFRDNCGMRPDVDLDHPNLRINIHINENICTVSLDSSGKSLHKRGYRLETNEAPISEALAAGLILVSGWDKKSHFVDGMCGSGTFLVEAAMIAANIIMHAVMPEPQVKMISLFLLGSKVEKISINCGELLKR